MPGTPIVRLFGIGVLTLALIPAASGVTPVASAAIGIDTTAQAPVHRASRTAGFGAATTTADVRWLAAWIADTHDNGNAGFIIVDKRAAQLHVFDADAHWVASTPVLLGAALGDDSVPGIGTRSMGSIRVHERTTPAGRFVGERGRNLSGEGVVWVDYDAAVSLHRVRLNNPVERRADRLASPTAADNRISFGCINVPVAFFDRHIHTLFTRVQAVIYVLPDVKSVQEVFGPHAVTARVTNALHP